jgi:hypothetical protein
VRVWQQGGDPATSALRVLRHQVERPEAGLAEVLDYTL